MTYVPPVPPHHGNQFEAIADKVRAEHVDFDYQARIAALERRRRMTFIALAAAAVVALWILAVLR